MHYHTRVGLRLALRLVLPGLLAWLGLLLTGARDFPPVRDGGGTFGAHHRAQVRFILSGVLTGDTELNRARIPRQADWRGERRFEGIGWELGSAVREDGPVMNAALTVVRPAHYPAFSLPHCCVLAAFDLSPRGHLLVAVRDPQKYWPDGNAAVGVTDPVDLVWYSEDWQEDHFITLAYGAGEFPDDFVLSPTEKYLLCIRHPEQGGQPIEAGHSLNLIWLQDGAITDIFLPEVDGFGYYPAPWQPLGLQFQRSGRQLKARAGDQLRIYDVEWNR
jgi:hypothetical protein